MKIFGSTETREATDAVSSGVMSADYEYYKNWMAKLAAKKAAKEADYRKYNELTWYYEVSKELEGDHNKHDDALSDYEMYKNLNRANDESQVHDSFDLDDLRGFGKTISA